jgi:hypothetical protein
LTGEIIYLTSVSLNKAGHYHQNSDNIIATNPDRCQFARAFSRLIFLYVTQLANIIFATPLNVFLIKILLIPADISDVGGSTASHSNVRQR